MHDVFFFVEILERKHDLYKQHPHPLLTPQLLFFFEGSHVLAQRRPVDQLHHYIQALVFFKRLQVAHNVRMFKIISDYGHLVDDLAQTRVFPFERVQVVRVDLFHGQKNTRVLFFNFMNPTERARAYNLIHGIVVYVISRNLRLVAVFNLLFQQISFFFAQLIKGVN